MALLAGLLIGVGIGLMLTAWDRSHQSRGN